MTKRLALIPARYNSKRILNKNIKIFSGKPIILHVLEEIKKSKLFTEIHISTESKEILSLLKKFNYKVDFMRPKFLAKDKTVLVDVVNFVINKYKKLQKNFDELWLILPTAVLIKKEDLIKASKFYTSNKIDNMMAVSKFPAPIEWSMKIEKNLLKPLKRRSLSLPSSVFKDKYYDTGTFIVYNIKNLLDNKISNNLDFSPYILPSYKGVDVDTLDDWNLALLYYKNLK